MSEKEGKNKNLISHSKIEKEVIPEKLNDRLLTGVLRKITEKLNTELGLILNFPQKILLAGEFDKHKSLHPYLEEIKKMTDEVRASEKNGDNQIQSKVKQVMADVFQGELKVKLVDAYKKAVSKELINIAEKNQIQVAVCQKLIKNNICTEEEFTDFISKYSDAVRVLIFDLKAKNPEIKQEKIIEKVYDYCKKILEKQKIKPS